MRCGVHTAEGSPAGLCLSKSVLRNRSEISVSWVPPLCPASSLAASCPAVRPRGEGRRRVKSRRCSGGSTSGRPLEGLCAERLIPAARSQSAFSRCRS